MWLPWDLAVVAALCLASLGLATQGLDGVWAVASAFARECALVLGLYAIWQLAGSLSVAHVPVAMANARWVLHAEHVLRLPSEVSVQRSVLDHPLLVQAANGYYAVVHVPALIGFLIWLFVRHRERYPAVRNTMALLTGWSLLLALNPVAPPRMFPSLGFVDTAARYGQSVYGRVGSGISDQLSAMPSVHVGWAVLVGLAVIWISPSRWRWLVIVHPVATMWVVVATGNHFWLDGVVAVGLLVAALALQWSVAAMVSRVRVRPDRAAVGPVRLPAPSHV